MLGTVQTLKYLMMANFNINAQSEADGSTPLHLAARLGKHELLEALLGAEDSIDYLLRDHEGRLAIDVAKNKQVANLIECKECPL